MRDEFPDDTRFQYNLWAYRRRLGIIYDKAGNFGEAIDNLKKSLVIIEYLAKSSPKDAGYKRHTSVTLLALGQAFLNHDEPKKALPVLLDARRTSESLLANDGNNGETIADLAFIYGNLGAALGQNGELDEAVSLQEKSLEFFARSFAKTPENIELKREYAKTAEQAAKTYTQMSKRQSPESAKTFREKANLLFEQSRPLQQ